MITNLVRFNDKFWSFRSWIKGSALKLNFRVKNFNFLVKKLLRAPEFRYSAFGREASWPKAKKTFLYQIKYWFYVSGRLKPVLETSFWYSGKTNLLKKVFFRIASGFSFWPWKFSFNDEPVLLDLLLQLHQ